MRRLALSALLFVAPIVAQAQSCPQPLSDARRLVLVVADSINSTTATLRRFARASSAAPWQAGHGRPTADR
jgi:hypothetical protein